MLFFNSLKDIKKILGVQTHKENSSDNTNHANKDDYFKVAKEWAYERYHVQTVIANRWQLAFWLQLGFCLLLGAILILLLPLKSWEPIVIHRNSQTGEVWVESAHNHSLPESSAEIESDLVRYVIARETYSSIDLNARYRQVLFSSAPVVAKAYQEVQDPNSTQSPLNEFGKNGTRIVKVQDIVFLETKEGSSNQKQAQNLRNLAKIDFVTTETKGQTSVQKYWVATLSWDYIGTPDSKEAAWMNWNGFTVTYYRVDQRNI